MKPVHLLRTKPISFVFVLLTIFFICAPYVVLAEQQPIEQADVLSIDNFERVSSSIWRGAAPSDASLKQLADKGIRTIIDLRMNGIKCSREEETVKQLGLKYVHLPMGFRKPTYQNVTAFLKTISDPVNLPVYIHCHQGADRTGVLVAIYRIIVDKWSFDKTYSEMRSHHFKPWLFGMKKSVAAVSQKDSVRQTLQIAMDNAKVN